MGIKHLNAFFDPDSIAVIGASEKPDSIGTALMRNLVEGPFKSRLFPVNPNYKRIMRIATASSIRDLHDEVDLALVAVPINQVPTIIEDCVKAGVKAAIIVAAGGKEIGEAGSAVEERIRRAAEGRIRIMGPNCLGVMVPGSGLNATFAKSMAAPGNLALVSQSGAICTAILDVSLQAKIGFSHFVSIGSMLDVDFGDLLDYLGHDRTARSILLYIEQITNLRKFMSAARAVAGLKPIIVLKAGASMVGAQAAASHTGALASEDAVYEAAFKRAGVIRVRSIEELFDCAESMAKQPKPKGHRLGVVSNGGGPGVMAADAMAEWGVEPAALSADTIGALDTILPPYWSRRNPVDVLGSATVEQYVKAVETIIEDPGLDGLLLILAPQPLADPLALARSLSQKLRGLTLPVFFVWMGGRDMATAVQLLNKSGLATYAVPERAVRTFAYMVRHNRNLALMKEIPPRLERGLRFDRHAVRTFIEGCDLSGTCPLNEIQAKMVLQSYGIAVNRTESASSVEDAVAAAESIGWPVAVKILSPDFSHKTEVGGVYLNIGSADDLRSAYGQIMAMASKYTNRSRIEGVTVQEYCPHNDCELLLGVKSDREFGPVVLCGTGGIYTELFHDRALDLPPLNRLLIRRLMEETRVFRLLSGHRNRPPVDLLALEDMLLQLSQLAIDVPEIAELDMNPVVFRDGKPVAVDARIILRPSEKPAPLHLIISPYPEQYEICTMTKGGLRLLIRPIKPEDADLFAELFKTLSPTSVYYRFFRHMRELTPDMLVMLTQVDYDRHLALVAIDASATPERMLGVARFIGDPDLTNTEFSIMIGDPWQGQGVGAQLLLALLKAAKQLGVEKIWGTVLRENIQMLRLAKKFGFGLVYNIDEGAYDLTINLASVQLEI